MNVPRPSEGMSLIVRTVCGWVKGFILLYGIYIILYGHLTPGGGFSGGVIAAAAFVLILLAEGARSAEATFSRQVAASGDCLGVLAFLALALLGLLLAGTFFANFWTTDPAARFTLLSSGMIPFCNMGIGLKVCCSLYLVAVVLSGIRQLRFPQDTKGEPR